MLQIPFDVVHAELDEALLAAGLDPIEAAQRLARAKAEQVDGDGRPVLAADTLVALGREVLGKPTDRADAAAMLERLSGREVQVVSGVALKTTDGAIDDRLAVSTLRVDRLDRSTIDAYVASGDADDKAGALAVQGAAGDFVTVVDGSRSNVVGLPLAETIELLRGAGIEVREPSATVL